MLIRNQRLRNDMANRADRLSSSTSDVPAFTGIGSFLSLEE